MARSNADYWRERFKELEALTYRRSLNYIKRLEDVFKTTASDLDFAIYKFFKRFAKVDHVTLSQANRILNSEELEAFHLTVEEYIKYGEANAEHFNPDTYKMLEEASLKYRVTRLEALSYEMSGIIGKLMGNEHALLYKITADSYVDRYYRSAFTIFKRFGVGTTFARIDEKRLTDILEKPWTTDGTNFSTRIWKNQEKLTNTLVNLMSSACIRGESYDITSHKLAHEMNNTFTNASRLVRTESAYFATEAQKDCFTDLGGEKYKFIATLDDDTDEECQELDGKIFYLKDMKVGVNAPPIHVNCRCDFSPVFPEDRELPGYVEGTRTARNGEGKTYRVPVSMTYNEWKKKYRDG